MKDTNQSSKKVNPPSSEAEEAMEKLKRELEQMTDLAKRTAADFANYKRQIDEERKELTATANFKLLNAIFPAIDNLKRASENLPKELEQHDWVKGVLSTEKALMDALASLGLYSIEEIGVDMNPHQHEVLMEGPGEKGKVVQIFEKGYRFNEKTIRPAKVQVGNGESENEEDKKTSADSA